MAKPPSGGFLLFIARLNGCFREDGGTLERYHDALARAVTLAWLSTIRSPCPRSPPRTVHQRILRLFRQR